jgi:beta-lactam-binding protein with PASTA domain
MAEPSKYRKFFSSYLWGNIFAVAIVAILLGIGVKYGIDIYTHHGESIVVPNIVHMQYEDAEDKLSQAGLTMVVNDTGYNKKLPANCILEQSPVPGKRIKSTHIVYVTINAAQPPILVVPDLIDNSSLRDARAQLLSMGFKVGAPVFMPGEKDWVYGLLVNGRHIVAGDRVSADAVIIIQVGDGTRSSIDSALLEEMEPEYEYVEVPDVEDDGGYEEDILPKEDENAPDPVKPSSPLAKPSKPSIPKISSPKVETIKQ